MAVAVVPEQEPEPLRPSERSGPAARVHYLLCGGCGYGVAIARAELPDCPMCGSQAWLPHRRPSPTPSV